MATTQHLVNKDSSEALSALNQLWELSNEHPSYEALAQVLSDPKFSRFDVGSRTKAGRLRAHGGYADVYDGELQCLSNDRETETDLDTESLQNPLANTSNTAISSECTSKKVAIKRFRIFLDKDKDFAKVRRPYLGYSADFPRRDT